MTLDLPRLLLGLGLGLGVGLAAAAASSGCSSSSTSSVPVEGGNACPATVDTTVGALCGSPGQVCSPTFPCGFATVTVRCVCQEGMFQCVDGSGNPFLAGAIPSCGEAGAAPTSCPATESAAMTAACSVAESGQQCAYPPKCAGGTLAFDRCTCEATPDGSGFAYDCENACNGSTEPQPEAGPDSGATDGSRDAPDGSSDAPDGDGAVEADSGLAGDGASE
jgi:hypothetical protein